MKIAITGAHGVGKTTLAEKLLEHLPDYELRTEPYYELEELGYEFSETPNTDDFAEQLKYSIKQIAASGDNVIFDRCPVDIMAYLEALNGIQFINSMYDKAESAMEEIDLIVYVPIEHPDIIPHQKSDYPELRDAVNEILRESVNDFGIEVLEVKGILSERISQVLAKIT